MHDASTTNLEGLMRTVTLRLPDHAYEWLKDEATLTKRSMNRMAEVMIEEYTMHHLQLQRVRLDGPPVGPGEPATGRRASLALVKGPSDD